MSLSLHDYVTTTRTDGGLVLLDERSGRYWQINESGTVALEVLLGGGTLDSAAEAVVRRYVVEPGCAVEDVRLLIERLRAARLAR